ncbi:hypothetical protein CI238_13232 [Colletotrichum incanum]|uniref:Uncharacterized protein n=1 Tax=Colletotrichum incanum TaxID=1573173 RepID=A0A167C0T5_COLIC|nr:hypothetical protein CI238_13232 [Colletotrichum incanum]
MQEKGVKASYNQQTTAAPFGFRSDATLLCMAENALDDVCWLSVTDLRIMTFDKRICQKYREYRDKRHLHLRCNPSVEPLKSSPRPLSPPNEIRLHLDVRAPCSRCRSFEPRFPLLPSAISSPSRTIATAQCIGEPDGEKRVQRESTWGIPREHSRQEQPPSACLV